MNAIERREAKRFKLDWTIKIAPLDSKEPAWEQTGILRDISSAGAYGIFENRIESGFLVKVTIELPLWKQKWMSYPARVLRVEGLGSNSGIAFVFDDVQPAFVAAC